MRRKQFKAAAVSCAVLVGLAVGAAASAAMSPKRAAPQAVAAAKVTTLTLPGTVGARYTIPVSDAGTIDVAVAAAGVQITNIILQAGWDAVLSDPNPTHTVVDLTNGTRTIEVAFGLAGGVLTVTITDSDPPASTTSSSSSSSTSSSVAPSSTTRAPATTSSSTSSSSSTTSTATTQATVVDTVVSIVASTVPRTACAIDPDDEDRGDDGEGGHHDAQDCDEEHDDVKAVDRASKHHDHADDDADVEHRGAGRDRAQGSGDDNGKQGRKDD